MMSSLFFYFCSKTEQHARRQSHPPGKWNKKLRVLKSIYLGQLTAQTPKAKLLDVYQDSTSTVHASDIKAMWGSRAPLRRAVLKSQQFCPATVTAGVAVGPATGMAWQ